jgi:LasA protease
LTVVRGLARFLYHSVVLLLFVAAGCAPAEPEPMIIYVTATPPDVLAEPPVEVTEVAPEPIQPSPLPQQDLSPVPDELPQPTFDPPRVAAAVDRPQAHVVRAGDTLYGIALMYGVSLGAILDVNDLENPDALFVGQTIQLPDVPAQQTPDFKIIPDSRLVRGPGSSSFDVTEFINRQPGYIRTATDEVTTRQADNSPLEEILSAAQVVERVSLEYSVDPRVLLALLEFRAGWLSDPNIPEDRQQHPLISERDSPGIDRGGLYRQLAWAANQLNFGYYGWKYRGWTTLEFPEGVRLSYMQGLNAGTIALQYFLSQHTPFASWLQHVSPEGFYRLYYAYFGDPFAGAVDPLVPPAVQQPQLQLPFGPGEVWFFTGGAHGGWGSGSAWAAVDFAPPDIPPEGVFCYVSAYWVRAVAPGIIVRSEDGVVVLDLEGDGDETTGWTVLYLHVAAQDRISAGTRVEAGDPIGRASCEGGFSTATHLHIARRYNGEWIPADCFTCAPQDERPRFNLGGWEVIGIRNQEYQGFLERNGEQRRAEQGRLSPSNRVSW